jgi:hypothetical protein
LGCYPARPDSLSRAGLTTHINFTGIRSLIELPRLRLATHSVLYPQESINGRYTYIYFGENQLSPGSIGILPLTTAHLTFLQQRRVRAFSRLSAGFTLSMVSSPGFGSSVCCHNLSRLGIAFTTPSSQSDLDKSSITDTHWFILQ